MLSTTLHRPARVVVWALALLCALVLWLAPASAHAHVAVRFSASLSSSHVIRARGVVHPSGRGLRVRLQLRTRQPSGREAWVSLGAPVPVSAHGSFVAIIGVPAVDTEVVLRAVVIHGRRLLVDGAALVVRMPKGSVLGSKAVKEPEPVLAPVLPPGLTPGPVVSPPSPPEPAPLGSVLASGSKLLAGEYLLSPDHRYELAMQGDGNLVLYHEGSAVWATYTSGSGNYLAMQPEGNLVVYNGGTALWNSSTWGFPGADLHLQNDGNLVVYQNGHAVWTYSSGYKGHLLDANEDLQPGAYLLSPDHEYQLIMQGDGNLVLYHGGSAVWATYTSGSGNYLAMQTEGNLVVYNGAEAKWNTGTWGFAGAYLQLQDDGNLVVYQNGHAVWTYSSGYKGQILNPNEQLRSGAYLLSPNHEYELVMQGEGNLVLYHGSTALWTTYTSGAGNYVTMQPDGNLVVYNGGTAQWSSATSGSSGAYLQLQNDDNLVIYLGGTAIWDWAGGKIGGGGSSTGERILNEAAKWSGRPYCWDGGEPNGPTLGTTDPENGLRCGVSGYDSADIPGFDCTGLTLYAVYQATGKVLPHDGAQATNAVSQGGQHIYSESELQPGDLVFFHGSFGSFVHAGVYAGVIGGRPSFWSAVTEGIGVRLETMAWEGGFGGGVRF
jgi:cell wall-associated NlpC family hydrolase